MVKMKVLFSKIFSQTSYIIYLFLLLSCSLKQTKTHNFEIKVDATMIMQIFV